MTPIRDSIRDEIECKRHCEQLLAAYDLVLDDLSDFDEDEWKYVRSRVAFMRADIVDARDKHDAEIAAIQQRCLHAYEKIGEAREPFWQCVECRHTRMDAP